jgi:hypothetical protein
MRSSKSSKRTFLFEPATKGRIVTQLVACFGYSLYFIFYDNTRGNNESLQNIET